MDRTHRFGALCAVTLTLGWLAAASAAATPELGEVERVEIEAAGEPASVAPESISEVMLEDTVLELEDAHVTGDDASVATREEDEATEPASSVPAKAAPSP